MAGRKNVCVCVCLWVCVKIDGVFILVCMSVNVGAAGLIIFLLLNRLGRCVGALFSLHSFDLFDFPPQPSDTV